MRFGQLIANLSTLAKGLSAEGLWDAKDEEFLAAARKQLAYFQDGRPAVALGEEMERLTIRGAESFARTFGLM